MAVPDGSAEGAPENSPENSPENTPENTPGPVKGPPPARPPGWRKAVPEKQGAAARRYGPPTHARPAARPAARPPTPTAFSGLPASERPPARPPARRPDDELRPYLPPVVGPVKTPRAEPRPPVPEHAVAQAPSPAPTPAPAPAPAPAAPAAASVQTRTPTAPPPAPAVPARSRAEARAATARPHARGTSSRSEPPVALPRAGSGVERFTAGDGEGWLVLLLLGALGIVAVRLAADLPTLIRDVSAVVVSAAFAWGLAVRTGGRPFWAAGLASALGIGAVVSDWHPLIAGAAVGTGVMGATLAVMATTPAATFLLAMREALVATAIAALGAIGAVGYGVDTDPEVDPDRFGYAVLALSLVGTFALVYRLGAGLHGLGRRGYAVAGGAVVMLVFALAYSEAIAHWGSRDFVGMMDDLRDSTRDTFGAVPHPIVAMLGYPALIWGVFMRARRRQGWWVCAFGVAGTAPIATRLVASEVDVRSVLLGGVYSFVVGALVGYLAIRVEQSLTGSHGRRARRDEEAEAHRPEPRRTRPLH